MGPRDRRTLVLGVSLVVVAWLPLRGLPAARGWLEQADATVAQRADLLARARTRVGDLSDVSDSIAALEKEADDLRGFVLVGDDAETASVDLMVRARDSLKQVPVTLIGFGPRETPLDPPGSLARIAIPVRIETDLPGLVAAMRAIETHRALRLVGVEIEALDPHASAEEAERLSASMTVAAWYRPASDSLSSPLRGA